MTQEDKKILLKDLCARLPYGVKYCRESWNYEWDQEMSVVEVLEDIDKEGYINYHKVYKVWDIKPYLRPLSSMTVKEEIFYNTVFTTLKFFEKTDWLNQHMFDYCNLIEKQLALEAPENMYNLND